MDNLQSITYDTFEQDPVKYKNYEEARTFFLLLKHFARLNVRVQAMYQALVEWPKMERT
jgi:hypothetical protein